MRMLAVFSVVCLVVVSGQVSAGDGQLEALFPDEGLRYKSCQIKLNPADDGYVIDIKRDCPSGYCYNDKMEAKVKVNAQQIKVFGKTLTNHHEIDINNRTTSLEVIEYDEWEEEKSVGIFDGNPERVLIGHVQAKLEMRIDNATGQVEKFKAYYKGNVKWGAALQGGILTTLRAIHAKSSRVKMVECETPAIEMRQTMIDLLEQEASVYEDTPAFNYEQRASLENKLLQLLSTAEKSELTDTQMFGNTPLHYAARLGLVRFAQQLIPLLPQEATDRYYRQLNPINFQNSSDYTPLHLAVHQGEVGMVKLLLAIKGIDIHVLDLRDRTAKQVAADTAKKHCEAEASSQDCTNAQEIVAMFAE